MKKSLRAAVSLSLVVSLLLTGSIQASAYESGEAPEVVTTAYELDTKFAPD